MDNMSKVEKWVLQNKDKLEQALEIMRSSEALAATRDQLDPILGFVSLFCVDHLYNPDGREAKFLAENFKTLSEKLVNIKNEVKQIALEMERTAMNRQNFDYEANMINQYEMFQEFVNAKKEFKDKKKARFLSLFENTDGDKNLDAFCDAVTKENGSVDTMLTKMVAMEQNSLQAVEEFCARLKKLFIVGMIAVVGYTALKEGIVGEDLEKKWQGQLEDVETRTKRAVDACTKNSAI